MKILRGILWVMAGAFLLYALLFESHKIHPRSGSGEATTEDGAGLIRAATSDRFQRQGDELRDTRGAVVPESASLDDCPA